MSKPPHNQDKGRRGRPGRGGGGNRRGGGGHSSENFRQKESFPLSDGISSFDTHTFEEGDLNNDETFGGSVHNLDQEFDFSGTSQIYFEKEKPVLNSGPPGFSNQPPRPQKNNQYRMQNYPDMMDPHMMNSLEPISIGSEGFHTPPTRQNNAAPKKMMSLAEVEAALMASIQPEPVEEIIQYPVYNVDWEKVRIDRKIARELREERLVSYNGIMCKSDKDFITRIQLSQLVTSSQSLALDDYYYRTFLTMKLPITSGSNPPDSRDSGPSGSRGRSKENQIARMQRQITKIVAESRRRQKTYPVGLENALGKVSSKSTRNPKQVLQVLQQKSGQEQSSTGESSGVSTPGLTQQPPTSGGPKGRIPGLSGSSQSPRERKLTIKTIEKLYDLVLEAEYLSRNSPPTQIENDEDQERLEEWSQSFERVCIGLWDTFGISEDKSPGSIVHILNVPKGKKVIPRLLRFLSADHTLNFITVLLSNMEELNVCRNGVCPPKGKLSQAILDEVELFLLSVCPPVINYVSEAPLVIVNGLLGLLMEKNNVVWISRSKSGLAFLTLFLTRIEMLRQSGGNLVGYMAPSPEVPLAHSVELYKVLFSSLQNHFLAIFPPSSSQIEDIYVWQFLAALAVGLNLDQQHQLVFEVREKVIENVTNATRGHFTPEVAQVKIANVNLFLHALGLDASQVNVQAGR